MFGISRSFIMACISAKRVIGQPKGNRQRGDGIGGCADQMMDAYAQMEDRLNRGMTCRTGFAIRRHADRTEIIGS